MKSPERAWLTASEACARLAVKPATLYAYVSRGLVRSQPAPTGQRGRRYHRGDIERLRARSLARRGHGAVAGGALLFGEPVLDTRVSSIGASGPLYRGRAAVGLARAGIGAERVAELLFTGELPDRAPRWRPPNRATVERACAALASGATGPEGLLSVVATMEPMGADVTEPEELERARTLIRLLAASPALAPAPSSDGRVSLAAPSLAASLLVALGRRPDRAAVRAVDSALVLCADHELNASTFAARVAAGAGADLPRCLAAALAVFSGGRHGGTCDRIEAMVADLALPERALSRARERMAQGQEIPGFGHPLYPEGDPRAPPLIALAEALDPGEPRVRALAVLREALELAGGEKPTLDHGLVALACALGLPPRSAGLIFAIGRSVGYVAHVLEQRATGQLLRPRARYVGP